MRAAPLSRSQQGKVLYRAEVPDVKILLIRLDHIGDLLLTTPLIRALSRSGHTVDLVTPKWLLALLVGNPHVAEAFAMEEVVDRFPEKWRELGDWIKARKYDCLLLPNPNPRQLLWASWRSGTPSRLAMQAGLWGRVTGHRCLLVRRSLWRGRSYADLQLDLARALGVPTDGLKPDYFCSAEERTGAGKILQAAFPAWSGEPMVGIHPGSSGNSCNLPSATYGELAGRILERTDWRVVITGSSSEEGLLKGWPKEVMDSSRVYNAIGAFDLRSLAAVISHMSRYIIGSTGPLHLASALGVPTLSAFCPLPPICQSVWGNGTGDGMVVEPAASRCREWRLRARAHQHCDFRGEITAETLWKGLRLD
jgi:ADP-heptose:LPS heptosyltransferase